MRPGIPPHVYGYCAVHTDGGVIATVIVCLCIGAAIGFVAFPLLRRFIRELDSDR